MAGLPRALSGRVPLWATSVVVVLGDAGGRNQDLPGGTAGSLAAFAWVVAASGDDRGDDEGSGHGGLHPGGSPPGSRLMRPVLRWFRAEQGVQVGGGRYRAELLVARHCTPDGVQQPAVAQRDRTGEDDLDSGGDHQCR